MPSSRSLVRCAVVCLAPADDAAAMLGGRDMVFRQAEMARSCGVERIILLGDGGVPAPPALAGALAAQGLRVDFAADAAALAAIVAADELLLVLQPGLWADPQALRRFAGGGEAIAAATRAEAAPAGFETIDARHGWAGAMVVPGRLVPRLGDLGADIAPVPALLRIALQEGVALKPLPEGLLGTARWMLVQPPVEGGAVEKAWLSVRLGTGEGGGRRPSRRLARLALLRWHPLLLSRPVFAPALAAAGATVALLALALAGTGYPAAGFLLLAFAFFLGELAATTAKALSSATLRGRRWLDPALDALLAAACAAALLAPLYRAALLAFMLVAALRLLERSERREAQLVSDRALVALALALLTGLFAPELALLTAVAALLAGALATGRRGITRG